MSVFNTLNKVEIIGRLGRTPELKTVGNGISICNFSIATNDSKKRDGEYEETTEWFNVVLFGKLAESVGTRCKKGTLLFIEGRLQTTKYTGKDGTEKRKVEVVGNTVKFLGNDEYVAPASIPKNVPDTKTQGDEGDSDDDPLPF